METRSKSETKSEKEDERSNSERFPKNFFLILLAKMEESIQRMEQKLEENKIEMRQFHEKIFGKIDKYL